eukprot:COSAG01_NODE_4132_length_5322_cov_3.930308_4_plen_89_part_00
MGVQLETQLSARASVSQRSPRQLSAQHQELQERGGASADGGSSQVVVMDVVPTKHAGGAGGVSLSFAPPKHPLPSPHGRNRHDHDDRR